MRYELNNNGMIEGYINLFENFNMTKIIQKQQGEKQKVDEQGNLLYKTNVIVDEIGVETYDETTEAKTLVELDGDARWIDNPSIMIPNIVSINISFAERPSEFTIEEVITQKYTQITEELGYSYALADCFITAEDLDLEVVGHSADTGTKIVSIHPLGFCQTKPLALDALAKTFLVYVEADSNIEVSINGVAAVNNVVTLPDIVDEIVVKFIETEGRRGEVQAYALFYEEEV